MAFGDEGRAVSNEAGTAGETEPSFGDIAESISRKIVSAIVIAAAIIGLAIYARPAPPRYQAVAADGRLVRIDTRNGTMIACGPAGECVLVLRHGQHIERAPNRKALPKQEAQPNPVPATKPAR